MHDTGTHRRGDASVFRSAPRRDGTPARSGSAIVTREASPGPLAYFIDQGMGVAKKHDTGTTVGAMHPCSEAHPRETARSHDSVRRLSHERHRPARPPTASAKNNAHRPNPIQASTGGAKHQGTAPR